MKLKRVIAGKFLHVPSTIEGPDRLWLRPGGIVDVDDPGIAKCVEGQEWKLEDAPAGSEPSPIENMRLRALVDQLRGAVPPRKANVAETASARAKPLVQAGIPAPDPRPKKQPAGGPF